ncbi:MAG: RlmE family RNA methyltransferase [Planctomycetota bacterium]
MGKRVLHDRYFKQAKRDGYLARSAYKLLEIDDRKKLLRRGMRALDLGCAPGSWLQVLSERVGPGGAVVGIDLLPVRGSFPSNVRTVQADFLGSSAADLLPPGPDGSPVLFDAVVSDMAPNTSGHGDDLRSAGLIRDVLAALPALLRPGGVFTAKIFEGAELRPVIGETRAVFGDARAFKPKACRDVSRETYIVAKGYRPPKAGGGEQDRRTQTAPPMPQPDSRGWA